jgi:hypothetical protein
MCSTVAFEQQVVTEADMYFSLPQAEVLVTKKELFNLMGLPQAQGLLLSIFCSFTSSVSDPDWIRIHSGHWIRTRIQEGKKDHKNRKKSRNFMF